MTLGGEIEGPAGQVGRLPGVGTAQDVRSPAGATPHCIDFILTAAEVKAESTALVFAGKEPLGYLSDHIGLRARLSLPPIG